MSTACFPRVPTYGGESWSLWIGRHYQLPAARREHNETSTLLELVKLDYVFDTMEFVYAMISPLCQIQWQLGYRYHKQIT
jgi:hypothetical protein